MTRVKIHNNTIANYCRKNETCTQNKIENENETISHPPQKVKDYRIKDFHLLK